MLSLKCVMNFLDYAQFELGVDELSQEELGEYVKELIRKQSIKKMDTV